MFSFFNRYALVGLLQGMLLSSACSIASADPSTAFFYGRPVPVKLLSHFEQVVVEPENMDDLDHLRDQGTRVFAYVSVGEVNWTRPWYSKIPASWFIAIDKEWQSSVVDLTQQGWHDYLINNYLRGLWQQGYRGFFLDGLESYQKHVVEPDARLLQEKALANLIKRLHQHFPGVNLILNRGFAVLPEVAHYAVALVAESLFQRWEPSGQAYVKVIEPDRYWLLNKLKQVRDQYGLQVIVVDYVDPKQKELARITAKKISELGFTPWVANPSLDILGIGASEIFPRQVLALYDGQQYPEGLQRTELHKLLAMPLEYLGCTLDYLDVNLGLPGNLLSGQYAGIVTWFNNDELLRPEVYREWLLRQMQSGVKVVVLGNLGFKADNSFLHHL
ncbi:MAG TPA: endo alpha-1,4 polygalactosaminidase, partial [Nitrosospira sp.]|nr:endo alpha-1,4 polygalactosaminidase [Nitrosospira sp.]